MGADETRGRSLSATTNGLLSAHGSHYRSGSLTPSFRSERSTHTLVTANPETEKKGRRFKRQRTQLVTIDIPSRWACLMGFFFGPRKTADMAKATVSEPGTDYDYGEAFDERECPFFRNLYVISRTEDKEVVEERCAFDTMCLQGNIVSLQFATKLGYKETDFKKLRQREKSGMSASGHKITPKGAILLSWYDSTSPQYSNMRFLVVENYHYALLIGTEAIVRHNLISPPNFSQPTGATVTHAGDKKLEELQSELKTLKDRRDKLREDQKRRQKKNPEDHDLDAKIEEAKRLVTIKDLQIDEYHAERSLKSDPNNETTKKLLETKRADIKELQEKGKSIIGASVSFKDKENTPPTKTSGTTVQVEEPKINVRTPTGNSLLGKGGPLRQRK